jgi:hypothetical protein
LPNAELGNTRTPSAMPPFRRRILIVTDSLGFPRHEPEMLRYEDTYIALLKAKYPQYDFIHQGYGGATIRELLQHTAYFDQTLNPALVIMQCGVVDCAPRALTRIEHHVIANLPFLKRLLVPLVKRYSPLLRRVRKITYTSPEDFAVHVDQFEKRFGNVIWLGIVPSTPEWEERVTGIGRQIDLFNAILATHKFIPTDNLVAQDMMSDHHHPNTSGHRKIFERLEATVDALQS